MSVEKQLGAMLCALTVVGLSACGGGGDSKNTDTTATITPSQFQLPAEGNLTVEGGDSSVQAKTYPLDTKYTSASGTTVYDTDVLEWVSPEAPNFDSGFIFAQNNPNKFALAFTDNLTSPQAVTYGCRSSAWNAKEAEHLAHDLENANIPICPNSIVIDPAAHHIKFTGIKLQSLTDASKSVTISANFGWVLQNNTSNGETGTGTGTTSTSTSSSTTTINSGSPSLP